MRMMRRNWMGGLSLTVSFTAYLDSIYLKIKDKHNVWKTYTILTIVTNLIRYCLRTKCLVFVQYYCSNSCDNNGSEYYFTKPIWYFRGEQEKNYDKSRCLDSPPDHKSRRSQLCPGRKTNKEIYSKRGSQITFTIMRFCLYSGKKLNIYRWPNNLVGAFFYILLTA